MIPSEIVTVPLGAGMVAAETTRTMKLLHPRSFPRPLKIVRKLLARIVWKSARVFFDTPAQFLGAGTLLTMPWTVPLYIYYRLHGLSRGEALAEVWRLAYAISSRILSVLPLPMVARAGKLARGLYTPVMKQTGEPLYKYEQQHLRVIEDPNQLYDIIHETKDEYNDELRIPELVDELNQTAAAWKQVMGQSESEFENTTMPAVQKNFIRRRIDHFKSWYPRSPAEVTGVVWMMILFPVSIPMFTLARVMGTMKGRPIHDSFRQVHQWALWYVELLVNNIQRFAVVVPPVAAVIAIGTVIWNIIEAPFTDWYSRSYLDIARDTFRMLKDKDHFKMEFKKALQTPEWGEMMGGFIATVKGARVGLSQQIGGAAPVRQALNEARPGLIISVKER